MWKDFKAFIARGNILDLAIAVILGAAFSSIVKTLSDGVLMPIIGMATGGIDFKQKVWNLGSMPVNTPEQIAAAQAAKQPLIMYGQLFNDVVNFLIVAFVMFLKPRWAIKFFKGLEAQAPPTDEAVLLAEIRDLLKVGR